MTSKTPRDFPIYRYIIDLLIDEELALDSQSLWYQGASDGKTWMYQVGQNLIKCYYN